MREFLNSIDVSTSFIQPGSPWENGYVESFHSRFRDECLSCEEFTTLHEAQEVIGQWRSGYNHHPPHSSLSGLTPAEFAVRCYALTPVAALLTSKRHSDIEPINQTLSA
ncbi:integrase core domain-containing protein [Rhodopirellula sp.]|nr:integrase core domain-containing protein [Rhodopirellula sp.]